MNLVHIRFGPRNDVTPFFSYWPPDYHAISLFLKLQLPRLFTIYLRLLSFSKYEYIKYIYVYIIPPAKMQQNLLPHKRAWCFPLGGSETKEFVAFFFWWLYILDIYYRIYNILYSWNPKINFGIDII